FDVGRDLLMKLLWSKNDAIVREAVLVIKRLLQLRPHDNVEMITQLAKVLDQIIVPMARASIWKKLELVAPNILRKAAKEFSNSDDVIKLQEEPARFGKDHRTLSDDSLVVADVKNIHIFQDAPFGVQINTMVRIKRREIVRRDHPGTDQMTMAGSLLGCVCVVSGHGRKCEEGCVNSEWQHRNDNTNIGEVVCTNGPEDFLGFTSVNANVYNAHYSVQTNVPRLNSKLICETEETTEE
ncbi:5420_t:CDS:2, partial [Paraglomus brasilianum]